MTFWGKPGLHAQRRTRQMHELKEIDRSLGLLVREQHGSSEGRIPL